jgi:hypothetical protein
MAKKKHYLTATLPDGYVKTIGPTTADFTHYWRIVAHLGSGRTEVFWGHTRSLAQAKGKRTATKEAAAARVWKSHVFEIAELTESDTPGDSSK